LGAFTRIFMNLSTKMRQNKLIETQIAGLSLRYVLCEISDTKSSY
jgi:hypothetical protein